MQISRQRTVTAVFVLKWEDVERIHNELAASLPSMTITSVCGDGLTRTFEGINELKSYRNSKKNEIRELEFVARDAPFGQRCSVTFRSKAQRNISFSLDAAEDIAVHLNDFHEDLLDSIRPWYSWVARINWEFVILGGMVSFVLFAVLWQKLTGQFKEINLQASFSDFSWEMVAVGAVPWLIAALLNVAKARVFPLGVFAIGDGAQRHSRMEVARTVFAGGFVVSVAASCFMLVF